MIANVTIFGNVRTDHVNSSPLTSSLIFSDFLHILQLCFISDFQCYHIWKCACRPVYISLPTSSLIFCIFYSHFSFMIANVTIFGNVHIDHVYIHPPASSPFISDFWHILQQFFIYSHGQAKPIKGNGKI
jgi:hypothetical protein